MTTSTATGSFYVSGGEIIGPSGSAFIARGINVLEGNEPSASTLRTDFPGINFVRLAIYDYQSAVNLQPYVDSLTNQGIVVELEDHSNSTSGNAGGGQGTIYSGSLLTKELNWYSSVASTFKDDAYVWFGTNNEPSEIDSAGKTDPAALSTWQQETYNAVRNAGNNSPVLLEANSGGPSNTNTGYVASDYVGMKNVVWDMHFYGWLSGYSTNQSTVSGTLSGIASAAQKITSADGTIPVIIGEYGNSTDGQNLDANASQVISAVQGSGYGNVAWAYLTSNADGLITSSGALSSFGQEVASYISSSAATSSSSTGSASTGSTSVGGTTTATSGIIETANGSVVLAGSGASIKDASGAIWTITNSGTVAMNGAAAGYTANVKEIALVNGTIWQENSAGLWWAWSGTGWGAGNGSATSPLKTSADGTVLTASSTSAITDASGNSWTIANGGTVYENGTAAGYTANVKEIALVAGTIWQENNAGLWWAWSATGWGSGSGSATSPVKASASGTVATPSGYAIIDGSGNTWTISSTGTVAENGSAAGYTANVKEIAIVNGVIWQENTAGLWWKWTGSAWSSGNGTATSPLG